VFENENVGVCECAEGLWDEVVAMAFATELTWGLHHNEEVAMAPLQIKNKPPRDAWSGVSTLQLGPLKHITTAQELNDAFTTLPPTGTSEAIHQLQCPDMSEVLQWFGQLNCATTPFMVWQDTTFQVCSCHFHFLLMCPRKTI
jgi:hypothetical protein